MKTSRTSAAAAAFLTLASSASATTQIFFDDFNSEIRRKNAIDLTQWWVTNGVTDIYGPGLFDDYPGNGNYIDMDGSSANAGKLTTKEIFALTPGQIYTLSFDYGKSFGSPTPERLSFGLADWAGELRMGAERIPSLLSFSVDFTVGETSGQLWINGFGGDNSGPIIDNVGLSMRVLTAPTPVPLPASGPILATSLAGLAAARRRRSRFSV